MNRHHRIRFEGRTVYLRNMEINNGVLVQGREVDREGQLTDRYRIISRDLVTKITPVVIDQKYGTFVKESELGG